LYLTYTHPDISYAVRAVSRYMQEPHNLHWKDSKRILRYVQGTMSYGIHYVVGCTLDFIGFTYSYWVGDSTDHKSVSWYTLSLGAGPICLLSKKQSAIALSSAEAEYKGVVNCFIQTLWLQHFLTELGIQFHCSTIICRDNQSTLIFCRDPVQRQ
jgi:hypothetical protein